MEPGSLAIASTIFSAVGTLASASASRDAANYNASIAQQNATISQQQGATAQEKQDRAARKQIGLMVANYGASGVDSSQGSPMDMLQESVRNAKLDNLMIGYNYNLRARGFENEANLYEMRAANASTSGVLGAAGALAKGSGEYRKVTPGNKIAGVSDYEYNANLTDW